jgi:hypothetical protein
MSKSEHSNLVFWRFQVSIILTSSLHGSPYSFSTVLVYYLNVCHGVILCLLFIDAIDIKHKNTITTSFHVLSIC